MQQAIVYSQSEAMIPNSIRDITQIIESKSIGHEDCDNKAFISFKNLIDQLIIKRVYLSDLLLLPGNNNRPMRILIMA